MHADAYVGETVAARNLAGQSQPELDRLGRVAHAQQTGVAEHLQILGVPGPLPVDFAAELERDIGGAFIAVGLCERREPGEVSEHEGVHGHGLMRCRDMLPSAPKYSRAS